MNFLASKSQLRASFMRWSLFIVPLIVLLGFTAGRLGSPDTVWFQSLTKPAIFPPPMWFGIVWGVLYVMIGFALALVVSAWGALGRGAAIIVFRFLEVGQYLLKTPARITQFGPVIVIVRLTAHVEQTIERTRPSEHFTPGPLQLTPGDARVRFGQVTPVEIGIVHGFEIADRYVQPGT